MAEAFPQRPGSEEPASNGLLMVEPAGEECQITAHFYVEPGDVVADAFVSNKERWLDYTYRARAPQITMVMSAVKRAVDALKRVENGAFLRVGAAFSDDRSMRLALSQLASLGSSLFWGLFGIRRETAEQFPSRDLAPDDLDAYGHCLRRWLKSTKTITIISPRNLLPWNLVYTGDTVPLGPFEADPQLFWAFGKHLVLLDHGTYTLSRPPPRSAGAWRLAAGVESQKPEVVAGHPVHVEGDHPFQKHAAKVILKHRLDGLFEAFGDADVLYYYGHAHGSWQGVEYGGIALHDSELSALDLEGLLNCGRAVIATHRRPLLVFLNGCSTNVGDATDETIPGCLVRRNKNTFCFVSTISSVPAWPAAAFARSFFRSYIEAGATLGDSLYAARQEMLTTYLNPVGLFYAGSGKLGARLALEAP
jgi:hypothetical protein